MMDNQENEYNELEAENGDIREEETAAEEIPDEEITDAPLEGDTEGEQENKKKRKLKILSSLYDYAEIFALSIVVVIFLFSFCIRLCRVDGTSMNNTLQGGERLIVTDLFYEPRQGDIVVFHLSNGYYNEPLVKRVIATSGQTVEINMTKKTIKVDGVLYPDEHAYLSGGVYDMRYDYNKKYIYEYNGDTYFKVTVPEGKVFVLGDNRNGSSDSRNHKVGLVDEDCILGRAVLRLSPFTVLD